MDNCISSCPSAYSYIYFKECDGATYFFSAKTNNLVRQRALVRLLHVSPAGDSCVCWKLGWISVRDGSKLKVARHCKRDTYTCAAACWLCCIRQQLPMERFGPFFYAVALSLEKEESSLVWRTNWVCELSIENAIYLSIYHGMQQRDLCCTSFSCRGLSFSRLLNECADAVSEFMWFLRPRVQAVCDCAQFPVSRVQASAKRSTAVVLLSPF